MFSTCPLICVCGVLAKSFSDWSAFDLCVCCFFVDFIVFFVCKDGLHTGSILIRSEASVSD